MTPTAAALVTCLCLAPIAFGVGQICVVSRSRLERGAYLVGLATMVVAGTATVCAWSGEIRAYNIWTIIMAWCGAGALVIVPIVLARVLRAERTARGDSPKDCNR